MAQDRAETGRLQELLARVGGGLDEFLKFEHADAMSRQQAWRAALEQPLPQQGVGIDAVVRELLEQVIPNGSQVSKPGFTAFITTGGTSVSTLASTAASIVRHNDMARALADSCRQHDNLELLLEPMLSVCCFRYRSAAISDLDQFNQKLVRRLIREDEFIPSTTRVNGQLAIRPCFLGARTKSDQVTGLIQAVLRIGAQLVTELK